MDRNKLRLIAFDMDGTVLHDGEEITPRLQRLLRQAIKKGIYVVPCTGRGRMQLPISLAELSLPYTITSNGARIRDERNNCTIHSSLIDWQTAADVFRELGEYDAFLCVHIDEVVYNQHEDEAYIRRKYHMPPYMNVALTPSAEKTVRNRRRGVEKIFVRTDDVFQREQMRRRILERYSLNCASSSAYNLEFSAPGCSKGAALRWLCKRLGVEGSQVMAFGDGENDREMLEFAGWGLAVGNALPSCKESADQVIGACAQDGVAEYLETVLEPLGVEAEDVD